MKYKDMTENDAPDTEQLRTSCIRGCMKKKVTTEVRRRVRIWTDHNEISGILSRMTACWRFRKIFDSEKISCKKAKFNAKKENDNRVNVTGKRRLFCEDYEDFCVKNFEETLRLQS